MPSSRDVAARGADLTGESRQRPENRRFSGSESFAQHRRIGLERKQFAVVECDADSERDVCKVEPRQLDLAEHCPCAVKDCAGSQILTAGGLHIRAREHEVTDRGDARSIRDSIVDR
jgi:hypothetical protein